MGTKSRKQNTEVTPDLRKKVLDYFFNTTDNRMIRISEKFDISMSTTGKIIDQELKRRMKDKQI